VLRAGASRRRIARTLNAAYADGLLSADTFTYRLDQLMAGRVIDPRRLVGDLNLRERGPGRLARLRGALTLRLREDVERTRETVLLALDWDAASGELLIGRHHDCDVVLGDSSVSRRHARAVFRDGSWILHDLGSTNGTLVNGVRVGRCELRPGDQLELGTARLRID
jgi:hypothetical protein